jgi:hypothetical protein
LTAAEGTVAGWMGGNFDETASLPIKIGMLPFR